MPPGAPTVTGRAAIAGSWRGAAEALSVDGIEPHTVSLDVLGDRAQEVGRAEPAIVAPRRRCLSSTSCFGSGKPAIGAGDVDIWNADS